MATVSTRQNAVVRQSTAIQVSGDLPTVLNGWRLIRRLAITGWFELYLAAPATCDPDWPADYVVKVLRRNADRASLAAGWLRREVEVARTVSHPHLATVLDTHCDASPPFVVQPYYEGRSLADWLDQGTAMEVPDALWMGRQVAEALSALHRAGWLHGDVKPNNIIVSQLGHATLIDLGFARRLDRQLCKVAESALQVTLGYAAPEMYLQDCPITSAADTYSLGVCLYEALSGQRLFAYDDPQQIIRAHVEEIPVDLRRLNPLLPTCVSRLIMRLLAKDPTARPSMQMVIDELVRGEIECFDMVGLGDR